MLAKTKITVIGGGHVGESTAFILAMKELADEVVLLDIVENMPQGKALDMMEAAPVLGYDTKIIGSNDFADMKDSDIVIMTAGFPRKPGMTREDLIGQNTPIMKDVAGKIKKFAPDSIVIVVANPLDAMTYMCKKITGFPDNRIIGQAGVLDSTRFMCFLGMETGVSIKNIQGMTLGSHGDDMVPLPRFSLVGGQPTPGVVEKDKLDAIIARTKKGGGEIVKLLGTSAYWAPAAGTVMMTESIIKDKKMILPCHAILHGEYGIEGLFVGVPVKLGRNGIEEIVEFDLTEDEKAALKKSADHVKEVCEIVDNLK
ncbi:MAG: malate dehydrogenase [Candidatus Aminicenantes bacterium]|nr:malate dehydrogenase [Candidatus Aminicenantes bacterium]